MSAQPTTARQVLKHRGAQAFDGWRFWLLLMFGLSIGIGYAFLQAWAIRLDPDYAPTDADQLRVLGTSLLVIFGPVLIMFAFRFGLRARVVIDAQGIEYDSPLPGPVARGPWKLLWRDIDKVTLTESTAGNKWLKELVIQAGASRHKLVPWHWVDEQDDSIFPRVNWLRPEIDRLVSETPLVQAFRDRGLLAEAGGEPAKHPFDSETSAMIVVGIFVALIAYFIVEEYVLLTEFYLATPPYYLMAGMGLVCGVIAYKALPEEAESVSRSRLVALLFGVGVALAAHPLLLRLNQFTDSGGLQSYQYTLGEDGHWTSSSPDDAPELAFGTGTEYWQQYQPGDTKYFEIRAGGLGFKQINLAPIWAEQREYYSAAR